MSMHTPPFTMARQFIFIGKTLIVALALSLVYFTLASAQDQEVNGARGATGEQVKICIQERKSAGVSGHDLPRAERLSIRQQFRTCIFQAVMMNSGHASSRSSKTSRSSSSSSFSSNACTPHWKCGWGVCADGWQSQKAVDSGNCGRETGNVVCPALVRQCATPVRCKVDTDCPQIECFVAPCPTNTCMNSTCVIASTDSSITVLSPNGGETFMNDGSPIIVTWRTRNVSSSQRLDVIRLSAFPDGQEYNMAYGVLNDGHAVVFPSSVPVGAYTLEIKSYVNGNLVMDASDSSFKIIDASTPTVSELVKCDFHGSLTEQKCYTATSSDSAQSFGCRGFGSCVVKVQGLKDTVLPWKSSCGGYANSTLDGKNEYVKFPCNTSSNAN